MNKLSFASVYRTAAILAAFSQAGTQDEEPACRLGARPRRARLSGWTAWIVPLRRSFERTGVGLRRYAELTRRGMSVMDDGATQWWVLQQPDANPRTKPMRGHRLVSHFAFCDEGDPHRPGARP